MRYSFKNLGLQKKIVVTAALLLTVSLAITSVVFSFVDRHNSRIEFKEKYSTLTSLVSKRSAAAIAFDDASHAKQNIDALFIDKNILYACLYRFSEFNDPEFNKIVAQSSQPQQQNFACNINKNTDFVAFDELHVLRAHNYIIHNEKKRGALVIYADGTELNKRFWSIIVTMITIGIAGALVAYLLAFRLLQSISVPILELKEVVNGVKNNRDFTQRAVKRNSDEVGELVDGFNQMLSQIETDQGLLEEMAYVDTLTDLPNRRMFKEQLARSFTHSQAYHSKVGVIFIDLDNFKWVNDSKGHDAGDLLLQRIASRMQDAAQANGVVCRLGGDEFTVIVDSFIHPLPVEKVAQDILNKASGIMEFDNFDYKVSLSLGVAEGDYLTDNHISIMKKADVAVYHAKEAGKGTYRMFDEKTDSLDDEAQHI